MSRGSPFQHAFASLAAHRFPDIRAEARDEHKDTADLPQFASLRAVQHLLQELESPDLIAADPDAGPEYLSGLYVAYRFWDAGGSTYQVSRSDLEEALERHPAPTVPSVPNGACYLQFPERWFWAQVQPEQPHEPVDGMFVVEGAHRRALLVLLVLGLRDDRPGFSQVSVMARPEDVPRAVTEARVPRFAPTMPGGESAGLKSLTTEADVLMLALLGLQRAVPSLEG